MNRQATVQSCNVEMRYLHKTPVVLVLSNKLKIVITQLQLTVSSVHVQGGYQTTGWHIAKRNT